MLNAEDKNEVLDSTSDISEVTDKQTDSAKAAEDTAPCSADTNAPAEPDSAAKNARKPHKEYGARMLAFYSFYTQILTGIGVIIAIAIAVAVMYNVIIGACVAISAALLYKYMTDDKLKKSLGLGYKTTVGGLNITYCKAVYGSVLWIPSELMWHEIISVDAGALRSTDKYTLTRIFLPHTLRSISPSAFDRCDTLREIYFEGSQEQWSAIEGADKLEGYDIIFDVKYPPIPKKKKASQKKKTTAK